MPMNVDLAWLTAQLPSLTNLQSLARGGQKQVFSGVDSTNGDIVLKVMLPGSDPDRVRREIVSASKVPATRMPKIHDHGLLNSQAGSVYWIVEQRIAGESLREMLKRGTLSHPELLRLALHVGESLEAAEAVEVVHRDVKPDNIIAGTGGDYWLIDFGIARHLDMDSLTATQSPAGWGTPGYSPVEQTRNDKPEIDARADLFALGVTLHEAATGSNPHRVGVRDPFEANQRAATRSLPRLTPPVPPEFADLVTTLSQPLCIHRPQTASDAMDWIRDLCRKEGVK